jgi:hypothetical protein
MLKKIVFIKTLAYLARQKRCNTQTNKLSKNAQEKKLYEDKSRCFLVLTTIYNML